MKAVPPATPEELATSEGNVSCVQASKQTFSSKADVKLCATNALILVHDAVFSMRMTLEAEKPLSNVPSAPWPFLRHK